MNTREVVTTFFEEVTNNGRLELLDELMVDDFAFERTAFDSAVRLAAERSPVAAPGGGVSGRDSFRAGLTFVRNAFDDYRIRIDDLMVDGDRAAGRWTVSGLHVGDFLGIAPTGRHLKMVEAGVMTVRDGKLASFWGVGDELGALSRLGAVIFKPEKTH